MLQLVSRVRRAINLAHLTPLTEQYVRASYTTPVYSSLKISDQVCVRKYDDLYSKMFGKIRDGLPVALGKLKRADAIRCLPFLSFFLL